MKPRTIRKVRRGRRAEVTKGAPSGQTGNMTVVVKGAAALVEVVQANGDVFSYDVPSKPVRLPATRAAREAAAATG